MTVTYFEPAISLDEMHERLGDIESMTGAHTLGGLWDLPDATRDALDELSAVRAEAYVIQARAQAFEDRLNVITDDVEALADKAEEGEVTAAELHAIARRLRDVWKVTP